MSTAVSTNRFELNSVADTALKAAAEFWFLVAVIGQWAFLYYIVAFYGPSTFTGNFQAWTRNTFLRMSYVPGDTAGNLAFAAHALLAAVIAFGGAIQLIPQIRARAISVHRWIGVGQISLTLWLLVIGVNVQRWKEQVSRLAADNFWRSGQSRVGTPTRRAAARSNAMTPIGMEHRRCVGRVPRGFCRVCVYFRVGIGHEAR
jgi:hypothetical protein